MGSSLSRHNFSSHVGIGSISQDLFGDICIICFISSCETWVDVSKQLTTEGSGTIFTECEADYDCELIPVLMSSVLSMKKWLKSCSNVFSLIYEEVAEVLF